MFRFFRSELLTKNYFNSQNVTQQPPRRLSRSHTQRECYYHFTVATDTTNIRKVFNDVHNMILTDNLTSVGLI